MSRLIERATGKAWEIPAADLDAAMASGLYDVPEGETAQVVDPTTGRAADVAASALPAVLDRTGARPETEGEFRARERLTRIEREHGGLAGEVGALVEGAVDTATLGGYGALTRAVLPDSYTEARRDRAEANPIASGVGTAVGAVAPALLSGGTGGVGALARATPMGLAGRAGASVAGRLGGGALATGVGMGLEGAIVGAGMGLQETMLAEDPVTVERLAGAMSSGALLGGVTGAATGVFARAAERA